MPVLVWFTFRTLSRRGVRLPVNWVNTEWDSTSTELTQKAPTFTKISSFRVDSVDVESHSTLTQVNMESNPALTQLMGMRLDVNWVTAECKKNLNKSANSSTKMKTLKSLIIWPMHVWSVQKTRLKSHASVPLMTTAGQRRSKCRLSQCFRNMIIKVKLCEISNLFNFAKFR